MNTPERTPRLHAVAAAPIPAAIEATAADWIVRRDAGLSPAAEVHFRRWLAADRRHAAAFRELESAWATVNAPRLAGRGDTMLREIVALEAQQKRRRFFYAAIGAGLAAAAAVVFSFPPNRAVPDSSLPAVVTVAFRPDRQVLPDDSIVELNAGAEIAVEFSPGRRGVRLVRGEAMFAVTTDPARPFVVTAEGVEVRAVGTAFSVRYASREIGVLVTEGRVAVQRTETATASTSPPPAVEPVYLSAGGRVVVAVGTQTPPQPAPVTAAEVASALAWRNRRVEFAATPLAEAVPLFNQHNQVQLSLADPATAALRITGVFWTDDAEGFARLLESSLGVKAAREPGDRIVLRR